MGDPLGRLLLECQITLYNFVSCANRNLSFSDDFPDRWSLVLLDDILDFLLSHLASGFPTSLGRVLDIGTFLLDSWHPSMHRTFTQSTCTMHMHKTLVNLFLCPTFKQHEFDLNPLLSFVSWWHSDLCLLWPKQQFACWSNTHEDRRVIWPTCIAPNWARQQWHIERIRVFKPYEFQSKRSRGSTFLSTRPAT